MHLEPDGTGHMFLDDGEYQYEENFEASTILELREKTIEFINNLVNGIKGVNQ